VSDIHDWAAAIRAREQVRSGLLGVLDHAADGPRRIEHAIAGTLGAGCALLWLGWRLGRR